MYFLLFLAGLPVVLCNPPSEIYLGVLALRNRLVNLSFVVGVSVIEEL
jgi:hypothetical protein